MEGPFGSFLPLLPLPTTQNERPVGTMEAESVEEDFPDTGKDGLHRSSPYTDGETRMVMIKDAEKDCWAMLVSQEMVDHINFAKQQSRAIEKRESALDEAATEVLSIEVPIEEAEDKVNRVGGEEKEQLQDELERLQVKLHQAKDRRDMLQEDMEAYRSGFECAKNTTQRMVEDALGEAQLLDPPEPDSPSRSIAEGMDETTKFDQDSEPLKDDEITAIAEAQNEDVQIRRAAYENLDQSKRAQRDAQIAFDGRKEHYERELARFDQLKAEGKINYSRSEFDIEQDFKYVQQLTKKLREADEWQMRAELNCQALGIRTDPEISYSDYSDYMDFDQNGVDDSRTEQDTSSTARLELERVEAWIQGVWKNQDSETPQTHDPLSFDE